MLWLQSWTDYSLSFGLEVELKFTFSSKTTIILRCNNHTVSQLFCHFSIPIPKTVGHSSFKLFLQEVSTVCYVFWSVYRDGVQLLQEEAHAFLFFKELQSTYHRKAVSWGKSALQPSWYGQVHQEIWGDGDNQEVHWFWMAMESNGWYYKQIVENQMHLNDKTMAVHLHCLLKDKGYNISLHNILISWLAD